MLHVSAFSVGRHRAMQYIKLKYIYKAFPLRAFYRPLGFQEVEAPEFLDSRHMKVVKLSALHTGRLYPPGRIPGTLFC
jgi:hypothetical protein